MRRLLSIFAAIAIIAAPATAMADQKSDCMKGVAMIKAQLKKKHPQEVRDQLQKALQGTQQEVDEGDWPECLDYVASARKAISKK
jgi:hypothetical protein